MATTIQCENTKAIDEHSEAIAALGAALGAEVTARLSSVAGIRLDGLTFSLKNEDDVYGLLAAIARKLGATVNE